jgi:hypothetical protein
VSAAVSTCRRNTYMCTQFNGACSTQFCHTDIEMHRMVTFSAYLQSAAQRAYCVTAIYVFTFNLSAAACTRWDRCGRPRERTRATGDETYRTQHKCETRRNAPLTAL